MSVSQDHLRNFLKISGDSNSLGLEWGLRIYEKKSPQVTDTHSDLETTALDKCFSFLNAHSDNQHGRAVKQRQIPSLTLGQWFSALAAGQNCRGVLNTANAQVPARANQVRIAGSGRQTTVVFQMFSR